MEASRSLRASDEIAGEKATAPRVTLADLESKIVRTVFINAGAAARKMDIPTDAPGQDTLDLLTICIITMKNGFRQIGKAAPADPRNFDRRIGERYAYEDAFKGLWHLEGYLLCEKLATE